MVSAHIPPLTLMAFSHFIIVVSADVWHSGLMHVDIGSIPRVPCVRSEAEYV